MIAFGIDPGIQECGVARAVGTADAWTVDRCALPRASASKPPSAMLAPLDLLALVSTARAAVDVLKGWTAFGRPDVIVLEWPEIYKEKQVEDQPKNPNDLLPLCMLHGLILGELRREFAGVRCLCIQPKLWTKGTPKGPRQRQWRAKRTPAEEALFESIMPAGKRHNAVDAAHMTAWGLEYVSVRAPAVVDTLTTVL